MSNNPQWKTFQPLDSSHDSAIIDFKVMNSNGKRISVSLVGEQKERNWFFFFFFFQVSLHKLSVTDQRQLQDLGLISLKFKTNQHHPLIVYMDRLAPQIQTDAFRSEHFL